MPNIKSSEKDVRRIRKRTLRNMGIKSRVRTAVRKFEAALGTDLEEASELLRKASSELDKAVSKGVLHKNLASRKKSRLARKFMAAVAAQAAAGEGATTG